MSLTRQVDLSRKKIEQHELELRRLAKFLARISDGQIVDTPDIVSDSMTVGTLTVTGNATIGGTLTVDGSVTFGGTLTVGGNILPDTDAAYDIGSPAFRFKNLYLSGAVIGGGGGATITGPAEWGPGGAAVYAHGTNTGTILMNSSTDKCGATLCVEKSGTINRIGFWVAADVGTPPDYKVGTWNVDDAGEPDEASVYGGSALEEFTPSAPGNWQWVTLSTPATAVKGDFIAIGIVAGTTPPSGSNNISVQEYFGHSDVLLPKAARSSTGAWILDQRQPAMSLKYDDDVVPSVLPAVDATLRGASFDSNTTPDEVGVKFVPPLDMTIEGVRIALVFTGNDTRTIKLYSSDDTLLASVAITDPDHAGGGANGAFKVLQFDAAVDLTAGETYRITVLPETTSADVHVGMFECVDSDSKDAIASGWSTWEKTERADAGDWTETPLHVPLIHLIVSKVTT